MQNAINNGTGAEEKKITTVGLYTDRVQTDP